MNTTENTLAAHLFRAAYEMSLAQRAEALDACPPVELTAADIEALHARDLQREREWRLEARQPMGFPPNPHGDDSTSQQHRG